MIQKVLQSGTSCCYYKVGQLLLQSGTGSFITKWDNCYYKVGQFYQKVGRVLQKRPIITKWSLTKGLYGIGTATIIFMIF